MDTSPPLEKGVKRCSGRLELRYKYLTSTGNSRTSILTPASSSYSTLPPPKGPRPSALVNTQWLHAALLSSHGDSSRSAVSATANLPPSDGADYSPIRVLDATWWFKPDFDGCDERSKRGHIPGAEFLDLQDLSPSRPGCPIECPIPEMELFQSYMIRLDVTPETHVVTYDSVDNRSAIRAWYLLRLFGHEKVSVLDGGLNQWRKDGFEVCAGTTDTRTSEEVASSVSDSQPQLPQFVVRFRHDLIRYFEEMHDIVETGSALVVDARAENGAFYLPNEASLASNSGGVKEHSPGHMLGAINIPCEEFFSSEGLFKGESDLMDVFDQGGVDLTLPIVSTSLRGHSACVICFAAYLLGVHDIPLYNGSWAEWEALAPASLIVRTKKRQGSV